MPEDLSLKNAASVFDQMIGDGAAGKDALELDKSLRKLWKDAPPWFKGSFRAAKKLLAKQKGDTLMISSAELAEMASSYPVASARYRSFPELKDNPPDAVYFPACGAGLDAVHWVEDFGGTAPVFACDIDEVACFCCRHNLERLNRGVKAEVQLRDAREFLNDADLARSLVFLDPARRRDEKRNSGYLPDYRLLLPALLRARSAAVKLSPGESPRRLMRETPQAGVQLIEYAGEVKEIALLLNSSVVPAGGVRATRISGQGKEESFSANPGEAPQCLPRVNGVKTGDRVLLPSPALFKSELLPVWAHRFGLSGTELCDALYTADDRQAMLPPLADEFVYVAECAPREKQLKKLLKENGDIKNAEPRSRLLSFPAELRVMLSKLKDKNRERHVILAAPRGESRRLIVLKPC